VGRVRPGGIAGPDPDEAVALDDRVTAHATQAAHVLADHLPAAAVVVHDHAVVSALEIALAETPLGQGQAPMGTEVFESHGLAVAVPVKDEMLIADDAAERCLLELLGRAGHVPAVFRPKLGSCGDLRCQGHAASI